jgi:NADP-dependent 3-hydroxy acid dehydrogenase YdfG
MSIRVSLVEPGMTSTPVTRDASGLNQGLVAVEALHPDDLAHAIVFTLVQPSPVPLNEVLLWPSSLVA